MIFVFILEAGEVIHNTLLFESMFLLFCWHKWLFSLFWKQGNLFIRVGFFTPLFWYFIDKKDFCFHSESRRIYWYTLLFQSIFRPFSRDHWLLFLFWKQGKLFITLCYFNPCFSYVLDINDFCFCTGSRGNYS